jgi:cholesterol transport system auxiliary component
MRISATLWGGFGFFFMLLSGCALPDKPSQALSYDFGPGQVTTAPANTTHVRPMVALADIETHAALDGTALLYRLAYADAQQLRPYAQARWSMAPAQLLRQRLREQLGRHSVVLNPGEATAQNARLLRIELEEFSQLFDSPASSNGLVRLRATVVQPGPQGERLLGQHTVVVQRPAPSPDAAGAVRALTAAADAAVLQLDQWLQTLP